MKRERMVEIAHRMLNLIDTKSTDLAPSTFEVPLDRYTSPEVFRRERQVLFGETPMFLGMSNEIREPGTYFTRDIVDTPFLCLRDKSGAVRLFLNSCRHRGAKVANEPCGTTDRFHCPFHAWAYELDGKLCYVPDSDAFDDMEWEKRGLIELPVAEKYGMIFGCAPPGTEIDIDALLGGLAPEFAEWGFDKYIMHGEPHVHAGDGNWKYCWDTFCENYHIAYLHANTGASIVVSRRMAYDNYGRNVRMVSAMQSIREMRKEPEDQWEPEKHLSIQYRLYPAVNFTCFPGFMTVYWVMPGKTPSESRALHITYLSHMPEDPAELARIDHGIKVGCEDIVDKEDFWITALSEASMHSPAAQPTFVMGRNEPALQHFNRLYAEATGV